MPDYINPNPFVVHLTGPDGVVIRVKPHSKTNLPDYFSRYVSRGFIKLAKTDDTEVVEGNRKHKHITAELKRTGKRKIEISQPLSDRLDNLDKADKSNNEPISSKNQKLNRKRIERTKRPSNKKSRLVPSFQQQEKVVGKNISLDADDILLSRLKDSKIPISNNIGIGILSHQRLDSLERLIVSIRRYTDLYKTTVFISDDGSSDLELTTYLDELADSGDFVVIKNSQRLGIAGNSNRLLRCLSRFRYGILLNDDVEVLHQGWEHFYVRALKQTGMHHFIFRNPGVYGAKKGVSVYYRGKTLSKVDDKPHGAVLAFTNQMLTKCGYFDEAYGLYGMEHVDWSSKAWEFGLQQKGFFDVEGSDQFYVLHNDKSSVEDREDSYRKAKAIYNNRQAQKRIELSASSILPEITYVVPFRDHERTKSIGTVINNIKAQRFPVIEIVMSEQDTQPKIDLSEYEPIKYVGAIREDNHLFNKSYAFNQGVLQTTSEKIILHDADMMTFGDYAYKIWHILERAESCHIGGRVLYTDQSSCARINQTGEVSASTRCERLVGYYEGGSLACTKKAYWKCGAFNEDYWGYGCEDCDFYKRLSEFTNWFEERSYDLVHLWHSRVEGWNEHHDINKELEYELKKLTVAQRVDMQIAQLIKNGYLDKLKEAGIL